VVEPSLSLSRADFLLCNLIIFFYFFSCFNRNGVEKRMIFVKQENFWTKINTEIQYELKKQWNVLWLLRCYALTKRTRLRIEIRTKTNMIERFLRLPTLILISTMFPILTKSLKPDSTLCPIAEYIDDLDKTVTEFFECPGTEGK
jgi:hypothetical protein